MTSVKKYVFLLVGLCLFVVAYSGTKSQKHRDNIFCNGNNKIVLHSDSTSEINLSNVKKKKGKWMREGNIIFFLFAHHHPMYARVICNEQSEIISLQFRGYMYHPCNKQDY